MPIARPTMLASASGELQTRSEPNSFCRPAVSLKTPPLPLTLPARSASSRRGIGHVLAEDDDALDRAASRPSGRR